MSTQENQEAAPMDGPTVLPVREVIAFVREWVEEEAHSLPHFAGAYLWAGITALPEDAPFSLYRDVDVVVVLTEGATDDNLERFYRGLMLEVIRQNLDSHGDPEAVLADPSRGPNIATTTILADPTGSLTALQRAVVAEYPRRRWVLARCEAEKVSARQSLETLQGAATPAAGLDHLWLLLNALSGLLAVAQLKRPTTRRTLALLGELLDEQGRPDLHEAALEVWGSAGLSRDDVQAMLAMALVAFDRSVEVYTTPTPFGFTIRAHLRPYLGEATQEMIDAGQHREATFWIIALAGESYLVLSNDAPEAEKAPFAAQWQAMLAALGYTAPEAWPARVAAAERLMHEVFRIADALGARHPE